MKSNLLNNGLARFLYLMSIVGVVCGTSLTGPAQSFKTLNDGVEHAKVVREISGLNVDINLLRLDLKKVRLDVYHALDAAVGTETTSSIARRHKAIAAINAGFFRLDKTQFAGDPVGLMMIDGKLLSEPTNERIQLLINNKPAITEVFFARTTLSQTVTIGDQTLEVKGINRERKNDDLVFYTPEFGQTTKTGDGGMELVIVNGNIVSVSRSVGDTVIPRNGFVVSVSGAFRELVESVAKTASSVTINRRWEGMPLELEKDRATLDIVTGVPQLIKNGRIDITWEQEKSSASFVETRHPRTAVAKLKDGKFLMIIVDGRSETSGGISLGDLADYLLELGATDAMNLDGGGSTTMFLNGRVVNRPSDKEGERKVSDALLVTLRKKARK